MYKILLIDNNPAVIGALNRCISGDESFTLEVLHDMKSVLEDHFCSETDILIVSLDDYDRCENVISRCFNLNPQCCLVLLYGADSIKNAVNIYNTFSNIRIINTDCLDSDLLGSVLKNITDSIKEESDNDALALSFSERESLLKKKMDDMAALLNTRVACYSDIIRLYIMTIRNLLPGGEHYSRVIDFIEEKFELYIYSFLGRRFDPDIYFEELNTLYRDSSCDFELTVINDIVQLDDISCLRMLFALRFLCDVFSSFSDKCLCEAVLKETDRINRLRISFKNISTADNLTLGIITDIVRRVVVELSDRAVISDDNGEYCYDIYYVLND